MTEPGATAAEIMRGKLVNSSALRSCFDHVPDRLRRDPRAPKFTHPVYPPGNRARCDLGGRSPGVNSSLSGVRAVINNVEVTPKKVSASEVKTKIEDALRRSAEVDARRIGVSASG